MKYLREQLGFGRADAGKDIKVNERGGPRGRNGLSKGGESGRSKVFWEPVILLFRSVGYQGG